MKKERVKAMNDTELLDWLDQQEGLIIEQDEDAYWYIRNKNKPFVSVVGHPYLSQAIKRFVLESRHEANRTL